MAIMPPIMTSAEFKRLREAAGLTQAALAGMIGVHPVTVARWETEMRRIPKMAARLLTLIVEQKHAREQSRPQRAKRSKRKGAR
jgi:DNA-binding transcriptional regulator YiaG